MEGVGCLVSLGKNQCGHALLAQDKLDENRVYLDSCSCFHLVFTKEQLRDIKTTIMRLKQDCNSSMTYSKRKGWCKVFHIWLVESVIANLLSIAQLESDGFIINYNTKRD